MYRHPACRKITFKVRTKHQNNIIEQKGSSDQSIQQQKRKFPSQKHGRFIMCFTHVNGNVHITSASFELTIAIEPVLQ
jgi:hypothetical protein